MNICILGTSHTASLKSAWKKIDLNYKNIKVTFFAMQTRGLKDLEVIKNKLVPKNKKLKDALIFTSGGLPNIDPLKYDVFLIYGGISLQNYFSIFSSSFSQQVQRQAVEDYVDGRLSYILYKKLRLITSKTIFIGADPLLGINNNINLLSCSDKEYSSYIKGIKFLNKVCYSDNSIVVPPQIKTISQGLFTKSKYLIGSKTLAIDNINHSKNHKIEDLSHMNTEYGEIYLKNIFELINSI